MTFSCSFNNLINIISRCSCQACQLCFIWTKNINGFEQVLRNGPFHASCI
eukprot:Gb_32611 [translate_table: standard]